MSTNLHIKIREVDRGFHELQKKIKSLQKGDSFVKVGVLESGDGAKSRGSLNNAQLAALHEFGEPAKNIPERSFIRATLTANQRKYTNLFKKLLKEVYAKRMTFEAALTRLGQVMTNDVKAFLRAGEVTPKNAPETVAQKTNKTPLVDTGQLFNAVSWQVIWKNISRKKGK